MQNIRQAHSTSLLEIRGANHPETRSKLDADVPLRLLSPTYCVGEGTSIMDLFSIELNIRNPRLLVCESQASGMAEVSTRLPELTKRIAHIGI
jgi:hypothetical protein